MENLNNYMGYLWYQSTGTTMTVGINEEGVDDLERIIAIRLPEEDDTIDPNEVCGEIETDDGPLNIYSPSAGRVLEVNPAVIENPDLVKEDCYGDGWLLRLEVDHSESDDLEEDEVSKE